MIPLRDPYSDSYPPSVLTGHPAHPLNKTHDVFGGPAPANLDTLAKLKADPVHGDTGTGKPANGAAANDPAFAPGEFVSLGGQGTGRAYWDGTAWQNGAAPGAPPPPPPPMPAGDPDASWTKQQIVDWLIEHLEDPATVDKNLTKAELLAMVQDVLDTL